MTDPRIPKFEDALDLLLEAALSYDAARVPASIRVWTAAELMRADTDDLDLDALVRHPLSTACRQCIRELGRQLFRITGSTDTMREVAENVAEPDPGIWWRRINILDKRWDGIGSGADVWRA